MNAQTAAGWVKLKLGRWRTANFETLQSCKRKEYSLTQESIVWTYFLFLGQAHSWEMNLSVDKSESCSPAFCVSAQSVLEWLC